MQKFYLNISINNKKYEFMIEPFETLLDIIRERAGLKGTKRGCDSGHCGACTVIMDGEIINSCSLLGVQAHNKNIITIEGLSVDSKVSVIQQSFVDSGAVQCGFCMPGMEMATKVLLDKLHNPNDEQIIEGLSGNICRCTGYTKIVTAVKLASTRLGENYE